jgi:CRISPR-associated protein Cas1
VAEIFKPIIIDRLIFSVIDKGMVDGSDFVSGTEGLMMSEKARKAFVSELEQKLETTINHRAIGHSVSYRRLIRLELYKIEKHIMGEKTYTPFIAQW